jgi:TolB-like protein
MASPPDIFLSYNREDQAVARRFAEAFEREGLNVWWDVTLRSGEAYDKVTEQALRTAKAVVVLWSKQSVDSRWVRAEATLADRQHTLVPAMIEPCERPIMFELTQTADLCHWNGESADPAWKSFLGDVQQFVRRPAPQSGAARSPVPASAPTATAAQPAAAAAAPRDHRPSLAILPFTNRSRDPDDDVFADGMVEDLVSALSPSPMMRVLARSATQALRGQAVDFEAIGRRLGVRYLLEGNVRRVGTTLRVTAQLVEAESGAILWSQRFDRPLAELADLQEALSIEVAAHLGVHVQQAEIERAVHKPDNLTAWEAVMRGTAMGSSPARIRSAIENLRRAVAMEPEYALAHANLAYYIATQNWFWKGGRDQSAIAEAGSHADRALALDSRDPLVVSQAAEALCMCRRWSEGLQWAERAFALNPNSAASRSSMIVTSMYFRRPDELLKHLDAYAELAPNDSWASVRQLQRGGAHYMAGRYEEALQASQQSMMLDANQIFAFKDAVVYLDKLGRRAEARDMVRRLRGLDPAGTLDLWEARHTASLLQPELATDMYETFKRVWLDTPEEPAQA